MAPTWENGVGAGRPHTQAECSQLGRQTKQGETAKWGISFGNIWILKIPILQKKLSFEKVNTAKMPFLFGVNHRKLRKDVPFKKYRKKISEKYVVSQKVLCPVTVASTEEDVQSADRE